MVLEPSLLLLIVLVVSCPLFVCPSAGLHVMGSVKCYYPMLVYIHVGASPPIANCFRLDSLEGLDWLIETQNYKIR